MNVQKPSGKGERKKVECSTEKEQKMNEKKRDESMLVKKVKVIESTMKETQGVDVDQLQGKYDVQKREGENWEPEGAQPIVPNYLERIRHQTTSVVRYWLKI